jgi:hypothetical protein
VKSTWQTWLVSTAAVTGVVGGGAVAVAAASTPRHQAPTRPTAQRTAVDTAALQLQVRELLAQDQALLAAVAAAKTRLRDEVHSSEASLRAVRAQLSAAQAALAAVRHARTAPSRATVTSTSRPVAHTTTGASGAASGTSSDDGGGHDD